MRHLRRATPLSSHKNHMKKLLSITGFVTAMIFAVPVLASADTAYNAIPSPLAPNYPSQPFQAQQTNEFGDYVHLGGTARDLQSVTVTMDDWALAASANNVTFCAANAANCDSTGFFWPITVNIYSSHLGANGAPDTLLATKTATVHIPWRPAEDPTNCPTKDSPGYAYKYMAGDGHCYNGLAANVTIDMSALHVTLPNDVIVGFVYNTETYGPHPTGVDGPYDSLNIAVPSGNAATVGTDDSNDKVFWNTNTVGYYSNHSCTGGTFCEDSNWAPYGTVAMAIDATAPVTVTIDKYLNGTKATAATADNSAFPMHSSWNATNLGAGSGSYTLSPSGFNSANAYEAVTANMTAGADYATNEDTTTSLVGASCTDGKPYALVGYTTGDSLAAAASATPTATAPNFSDIQKNEYVIVWNVSCGSLKVTKTALGGNGSFSFTGTGYIGLFGITTVGGTGSKTFLLPVGTYSVTETVPHEWKQLSNSCTNVAVTAGATASCTIVNKMESATITVYNRNTGVVTNTTVSSASTGGNSATGGAGGSGGAGGDARNFGAGDSRATGGNGGTGGSAGSASGGLVTSGSANARSASIVIVNSDWTRVTSRR